MGFVDKVKEGYFKIEDKWFDLLDFLDSKNIPVYSVIDPIEKAGVPSLPLFIALILIGSYFLLGGVVGGAPAHEFTLSITDAAGQSLNAYVELMKGGEIVYSGNVTGQALLSLPLGDYLLHASAFGCDELDNYPVLVDPSSSEVSVTLSCEQQPLAKTVRVCFDPDDNLGNVNMKEKGGSTTVNCNNGGTTCEVTVDATSDKKYSFRTSTDFVSDYYSGNELITMENNFECVKLFPYSDPNAEKGRVVVTAKNQEGQKVGGVIIQLVKPNSSYVIDEKTTYRTGDNVGTAVFTPLVGTVFTVKAQPSNSTAVYEDDAVYNVTSTDTMFIDITLDPAAQTNITVLEETTAGTVGIAGASIMVYDSLFTRESQLGPFFTNTDGLASIGLEKGVEYNAVVYKHGYLKKEVTIKGGEAEIVTLEGALPNETGDLTAYVVFSDTQEAIPDVQVELYKDGKPTGIPSTGKTDYTGKTAFYSVPVGTGYCAKAIRPEGESECVDVNDDGEVKSTKYNEVIINIPRGEFELFVDVTVNGAEIPSQSKNQPSVKAIDKFTGEEVDSATVNPITGIAKLSIPEDTDVEIIGEYSDDTGYYTASKDIGDIETFIESNGGDPLTTLDLKKVENKVSIVSIEKDEQTLGCTAGEVNEEGELVSCPSIGVNQKGKQYTLTLSIGTSNKTKWDEIKVTLSNEDNAVEFLEPQSDYVDEASGVNTNTLMLNINPKEADGSNLEIEVPFRVKTTAETGETNISYKAHWEKSNKKLDYPAEGVLKEAINITGCEAVMTSDGVSVCLEMDDNSMGLHDEKQLTVTFTNENQNAITSSFGLMIDEDHFKVFFTGKPSATKEGEKVEASIETNVNSNDAVETEEVRLEHGGSLTLTTSVYSFETGDARIFATKGGSIMEKADTGEDLYYGLNVEGDQPVIILIQPSELYDLTNSINITVKTSAGTLSRPVDVADWEGAITISGDALDCGGEGITVDYTGANVVTGRVTRFKDNSTTLGVNFDSSCKLREGTLTFTLSSKNAGGLKETDLTTTVSKAILLPDTNTNLYAPFNDEEGRTITVGETSEDYPGMTVTKDDKGYWTEAELMFKPLTEYKDYEVSASKTLTLGTIGVTGKQVTFKYDVEPTGTSETGNIIITLTFTREKGGEATGDDITSEYTVSVPVIVEMLEQLQEETQQGFTALKIQSCSGTPDCISNYCNMKQAFEFLNDNNYAGETNLKLVDSSYFTPQDLQEIWGGIVGEGKVGVVNSVEELSEDYGVNADPSRFSFTGGGGEYSFNFVSSGGKKFLRSVSDTSDDKLLAEKVQLLMPLPCGTTGLSDDLKRKLGTEIVMTERQEAAPTDLEDKMKKVIKTMWGVSDDQFVDNAYHKVVLTTCNPDNSEEMDSGYCKYVKDKMLTEYGTHYSAVILPIIEEEGSLVIFAGKTWADVEDLVKRFNNTVNKGLGAQLVVEEIEAETEEGGAITLGSVLVRPTNTVVYVCQEKTLDSNGNPEISDCNLGTVDKNNLENSLKKVFSKEKGYPVEEINVINKGYEDITDYNKVSIFIGLCADEDTCSAEGKDFSISISNSYSAMGIEQSEFSVPEGGAFFIVGEGNAPKYRAYAHDVSELVDLLNAYAEEAGTRATEGEVVEVTDLSDLSECSGDSDFIGTIGGVAAGDSLTVTNRVENGVKKGIDPLDMKAKITAKSDGDFKLVTPSSCSLYAEESNTGREYSGIKFVKINNECYIIPSENNALLFPNSDSYTNVYFQCLVNRGTVAGEPITINVVQGS